jgi:hypothetical protein
MALNTSTRVALRQCVDQFSEELVERTDKTMSKQQMEKIKKQRGRQLKLSQLNNFLGVALETDSPAVVVNWVRYQMGRNDTRAAWSENGLGPKVVRDIEALQSEAQQVAQKAFGNTAPDYLRRAHIALVRRYVGYLKRWFVARGGQQK